MKRALEYVRYIKGIPAKYRRLVVMQDVEVRLYRTWCWLRGRKFKQPQMSGGPRACYLVTKYIPELFPLLVCVELEAIKLKCPGRPGGTQMFYRTRFWKGPCAECGRMMELTGEDGPAV
jgi:hypothetical protein